VGRATSEGHLNILNSYPEPKSWKNYCCLFTPAAEEYPLTADNMATQLQVIRVLIGVCRKRRSPWKHAPPMEPAKIALASGNGQSASHPVDPVDVRRQQYQTPGTVPTYWRRRVDNIGRGIASALNLSQCSGEPSRQTFFTYY